MRPFTAQPVLRGRPKARRRSFPSGSPGAPWPAFLFYLLVLAGWFAPAAALKALPVSADGFSAVYFQATSLQDAQALTGSPVSGNPATDIVPQLNFSSVGQPWAPVNDPNLFSARFTGKFSAPASGT